MAEEWNVRRSEEMKEEEKEEKGTGKEGHMDQREIKSCKLVVLTSDKHT